MTKTFSKKQKNFIKDQKKNKAKRRRNATNTN